MFQQCIVNQPVKIPFTTSDFSIGKTSFSGVNILLNGATASAVFSTTEIGNGLYVATIVPNSTGQWALYIEGKIYTFEVVDRDLLTILKDISDEALGSWQWDKVSGSLTLLRQDGNQLATFAVTDTSNSASRERLT